MNLYSPKSLFKSPLTFLSLAFLVNCIGDLVIADSAQAFTLDFNNPAVIDPNTGYAIIDTGVDLDPSLLDGAGQSVDLNDGNGPTTFSTTAGSRATSTVSDLFALLGIDITASGAGADGVGLFNSECNTRGNPNCVISRNGDNDLQTGTGRPATPLKGNLLINEENAGDGVPDDFEGDGDLVFTFDQGGAVNNVILESITFVDDVEAEITVTFTDSTNQVIGIDFTSNTNPVAGGTLLNPGTFQAGDNAVGVIGGFTQNNVADINIDFAGNGGIAKVTFATFTGDSIHVPFEFSPGLGLILSGFAFAGLKIKNRRKK